MRPCGIPLDCKAAATTTTSTTTTTMTAQGQAIGKPCRERKEVVRINNAPLCKS